MAFKDLQPYVRRYAVARAERDRLAALLATANTELTAARGEMDTAMSAEFVDLRTVR